jgi:hypothetical protein
MSHEEIARAARRANFYGAVVVLRAFWRACAHRTQRLVSIAGNGGPQESRCRPMNSPAPWLPPWLHLLLSFLLTVVGLFGGALAGFYLFLMIALAAGAGRAHGGVASSITLAILGVTFFFGGAAGGLHLAGWLTRRTPARCPACGGEAYYNEGKPITFRCGMCGHVHRSIWSTRGPSGARRG